MKRLFLFVSFLVLSAQAQEDVSSKDKETTPSISKGMTFSECVEDRQTLLVEAMYYKILCTVKGRDVELLKKLLDQLKSLKIEFYVHDMLLEIMNDMDCSFKTVGLLGLCGVGIYQWIDNLKKFRSLELSWGGFLCREVGVSVAFALGKYLIFRKDYQVLTLLMNNENCLKDDDDIILIERLRRKCWPLFYEGQEGVSLKKIFKDDVLPVKSL